MIFTGKLADVNIDFNTRQPKITFLINEKDALSQVDEIKDIEKLSIEAKKYRKQRSLDANAYFHVLVNKLARKLGTSDSEMKVKLNLEYGTVATNQDGTKFGIKVPYGSNIEQFYKYCKKFGECVENGITFEKYLLYKETHTLDSKEMAQLIDGVVSECKEQGIEVIPEDELKSLLGEWKRE
jgi:hypothetical protein